MVLLLVWKALKIGTLLTSWGISTFDLLQIPPIYSWQKSRRAHSCSELLYRHPHTYPSASLRWLFHSDQCEANQPPDPLHHSLSKLTPTDFSTLFSSILPSSSTFSLLEVKDTTNTIFFTLGSYLDSLCPLSTGPARSIQPQVWYHR